MLRSVRSQPLDLRYLWPEVTSPCARPEHISLRLPWLSPAYPWLLYDKVRRVRLGSRFRGSFWGKILDLGLNEKVSEIMRRRSLACLSLSVDNVISNGGRVHKPICFGRRTSTHKPCTLTHGPRTSTQGRRGSPCPRTDLCTSSYGAHALVRVT